MALFGRKKTLPTSGESAAGPATAEAPPPGPKPVTGLDDLHDIAARGTADDVVRAVAAGGDVDAPNRVGYTPLGIAASRGDVDVARALLDAGAAIDPVDNTGGTPLAAAVLNSKGRGEMITLLLSRGADPSLPNKRGQSPLDLARRMSAQDIERFFQTA